jgi:hypothetical protein
VVEHERKNNESEEKEIEQGMVMESRSIRNNMANSKKNRYAWKGKRAVANGGIQSKIAMRCCRHSPEGRAQRIPSNLNRASGSTNLEGQGVNSASNR